jgi:hypothetical protein
MAEAQTARDTSVHNDVPPLKWLSGKLKVQMLVVHGVLQLSGLRPGRFEIYVSDWDLL